MELSARTGGSAETGSAIEDEPRGITPGAKRKQEGGTMKHEYTVETQGGMTCGHRHRTAQAAEQCRRRLCDDARYYGAEVRKNGVRANGIGLWADGEARI